MTTTTLKPLTTSEKNEAARQKLRQMGIQLAPKDAWKQSFGSMKDCEYFDEAIRIGAAWRAEENRKSLLGDDADS